MGAGGVESVPRVGSGQQGGQRGQIILEREQGNLDQLSSCGEGTKQWDSRYIFKAELKRGESEARSHRFWSECLFLSWLKPWEDHISGDNSPEPCSDSLRVRCLVGIQVELVTGCWP